MRPNQHDAALLWDMLDACRAVASFVEDRSFEEYESDRMLRGAVERHVEIIGEAAGKVSAEFQNAHPEIPWRRIVGQRNVLAHAYGDIDHDLIWKVTTQRVPDLIRLLLPLLDT